MYLLPNIRHVRSLKKSPATARLPRGEFHTQRYVQYVYHNTDSAFWYLFRIFGPFEAVKKHHDPEEAERAGEVTPSGQPLREVPRYLRRPRAADRSSLSWAAAEVYNP